MLPSLVLELGRTNEFDEKVNTDVNVPLDATNIYGKRYKLDGVVMHHGKSLVNCPISEWYATNSKDCRAYQGHYTAFTQHHDEWFFCNDKQISRTSPDEISKSSLNGKPYLLFLKCVD